jgi:hypothetical protein
MGMADVTPIKRRLVIGVMTMRQLLGWACAGVISLGLAAVAATPATAQQDPQAKDRGQKAKPKDSGSGQAPAARSQPLAQRSAQPQGQQGQQRKSSNSGRNIAAGVAAGVAGAIILNEVARANRGSVEVYEDDGDDRPRGLSCRQLERRCDDGQDWACRRLDRNSC